MTMLWPLPSDEPNPPLGYDVRDRKLVVNEAEAETVRYMMRRYLELGGVYDLVDELRAKGITSKARSNEKGKIWGGQALKASAVYHLLQNQLYRGLVVHKGETHPGEHDAIVDDDLWFAVQKQLSQNRLNRRIQVNAADVSLLAGMIRDGEGRRMTPSHARRGDIRYRYYNSVDEGDGPKPRPIRISARDIEKAFVDSLQRLVADQAALMEQFSEQISEGYETTDMLRSAGLLHRSIPTMPPSAQRALLMDLNAKVSIHVDRVEASVGHAELGARLGLRDCDPDQPAISVAIPTVNVRRGDDLKLVIQFDSPPSSTQPDLTLLELIAKAHQAKRLLGLDGSPPDASMADYNTRNELARLARFAFLAPAITASILSGSQPAGLSVRQLRRTAELPLDWDQQEHMLGFG